MTVLLFLFAFGLGSAGFFFAGLWGYLIAQEPSDPTDVRFALLGAACFVMSIVLAGVA